MTWWAIDVRTAPEHRDAVGAWLVARTGHAVEEREDGLLVGFTADDAAADRLLAELACGTAPTVAGLRLVEPVDWSVRWREGLGVRRIGRLTIAPSWAPLEGDREPLVVLDPEMAFGSGEHGSTRTALALMGRHLREGDRVLDLGSGSGVLAIAAVKLGAARATGIENDPEANVVADRNAVQNGVAGRATFVVGDAAALTLLAGPAELVCSNIVLSVNTALLPAIAGALSPGGRAVFAGMEAEEAEAFRSALAGAGFVEIDDAADAGWWAVAAALPR